VTEEGESGDSLYVIETGTASVSVRGDRKGTLGPGGYFGEVAVIDAGPRTATITAETSMSTLELPSDSMQRLLDGDPAFRRAIYLGLDGILRNAGASVPEDHGSSVDRATLTDLCRRLRGAAAGRLGPASLQPAAVARALHPTSLVGSPRRPWILRRPTRSAPEVLTWPPALLSMLTHQKGWARASGSMPFR
jgi:CRP-like cAMP-binding protein